MDAAEELAPEVGTAVACRAMGVSRATLYRRTQPDPVDRRGSRSTPSD